MLGRIKQTIVSKRGKTLITETETRRREIPKVEPTSANAKRWVKEFCGHVVSIKIATHTFKILFEDKSTIKLMQRTAGRFFHDLNGILIGHALLEYIKILEPAVSGISGQENFSVDNLFETINWGPEAIDELTEIRERLVAFGKYIKPARNKLLAHYDKKTVLAKSPVGAFPAGEELKFINDLERLCDVMHKECFGQIFGQIVVSGPGDVLDLKKTLRKALTFDKLFSESKGPDKGQLFQLLQTIEK